VAGSKATILATSKGRGGGGKGEAHSVNLGGEEGGELSLRPL